MTRAKVGESCYYVLCKSFVPSEKLSSGVVLTAAIKSDKRLERYEGNMPSMAS